MQKNIILCVSLMVCASTVQSPAFASDQRAEGSFIHAALPLAHERAAGAIPSAPMAARKLENVPVESNSAADNKLRSDARNPSGEGRETKLALLHSTPLASRDTATGTEEQWVRIPDSPIPEPGTWAILLAGFLGICAVARPRIFSS